MKKAFTLIELLIVIAIIGLLVIIIAIPINRARQGASIARILQYEASLHRYLGSDIVGWWQFNGDLTDISGYNNHGIWEGDGEIDFQEGVPGKKEEAVNLLSGATRPAIELNSTIFLDEEFTVSLWFITRRESSYRMINNDVSYAYAIWHRSPSRIEFSNPSSIINLNEDILTNQWKYMTFVRDKDDLVEIYRNGELVGSNTWTGELRVNRIGGRTGNTGWSAFDGLIDDLRIYSRALTSKEINTLYTETKNKYITEEL